MNERLKQRRARARDIQEYHLARAWEKIFERQKQGDRTLAAKTTRAAKSQCKRLFTSGCMIKGYRLVTNIDLTDPYPECIYECVILPQGEKQPGGRSAFSNREETHRLNHGLRGRPHVFIKPEWFEVEMYN